MMVILSSRVILVICIFTWFPLLYWKSSPSVGGTLFWLSALPTIAEAHWLITQSARYWQLTAHLSIRSLKHKLIKLYSGLRKDGSEPRQILNRVRCSCIGRSYGTVSDDICRGNVCMRMLSMENEPPESREPNIRLNEEMHSDCFKILKAKDQICAQRWSPNLLCVLKRFETLRNINILVFVGQFWHSGSLFAVISRCSAARL